MGVDEKTQDLFYTGETWNGQKKAPGQRVKVR